ncbi:MAG TPA: hypothetical protein VEF53_00500 [Patescibacteria group bacterium]|nr:hypothetical protein [Patescibacteria group bacterium]
MKNKNWIKSSWTISIGTAIFSLLLTMGYDYSKSKPILSTILQILKEIWNFTILVLNFNFKVWWLIVGIIVLIAITYLVINSKPEETFKPDFYSYREGKFKLWRWSWNWKWNNSKNVWCISDLTAHCPNCDTPLIEHSSIYGLIFDCPRCDFRAKDSQSDEPNKIEMIILDNIERKRRNKST